VTHCSFPDDPHIERIAAALWSREPSGTAALLVGAGFSRNAVPKRPSGGTMPGWNDIYATMVEQLYPAAAQHGAGERPGPREWLMRQIGATSAYLRVAEEFEAQFGRDALDKLVLQHVPDQQFAPGKLHRMLVELPWADIMTTNWDTLLERAAEGAEEQVYDVVRTIEEIPAARSPRIVKLHGSFPSNLPFVFTEEDFRTYPARAGAFVNLAQQLAMENTLVLLGFSGDDPNFLFWSGWVRDRLGARAPLIYLVGMLDLTAPKRKMLEARRIQPIDLMQLSKTTSWPESRRIGNAHQWFLERLRAAEPYPQQRWPRPAAGFVPPLEFVAPTIDPRAPLPDPEPSGQSPAIETLSRLVAHWRQNRMVYPGWIVPPLATSKSVWARINRHLRDIVWGLDDLPELERLKALYELNWQLETALIPLVLTVDDKIVALLDALQPRYASLSPEAASQFRGLALALIRHAREENDPELFARWVDWLTSRLDDEPDMRDRLRYERCLERRAELDFDGLEALVRHWTVAGDTFWSLRKAALLADLGFDADASELSAQTLIAIRDQALRGRKDIASWSRESFAMLFRTSALQADFGKWVENKPVRDRFELRQEALQARGCSARADFFALVEQLAQLPPPLRQPEEFIRKFDLGSATRTVRLGGSDPRAERLLAFQALRFQEESGLPIRLGNAGVAGQILTGAAGWLMDIAPTRAIDALLHVLPGGTGEDIDLLLTRGAVAGISEAEAQRLLDRTFRLTAVAARRAEGDADDPRFWIERLKSVCEIGSRIVLRVPACAPALLTVALDLHRKPRLSRLISLGDTIPHLVKRSLEAARPIDRDAMLLALFAEPIPPAETGSPHDRLDLASGVDLNLTVEEPGPEWEPVIERTIAALENVDTRLMASARLGWLWGAGLIGKHHHAALAAALWAPAYLDLGLPGGTVFVPTAFLTFPSLGPDGAAAEKIADLLDERPLSDEELSDGSRSAIVMDGRVALDAERLCAEIERLRTFVADQPPKPMVPDLFDDWPSGLEEGTARHAAALSKRALDVPTAEGPLKALIAAARYPLRLEPAMPALAALGLIPPQVAEKAVRDVFAQPRDEAGLLGALLDQYSDGVTGGATVDATLWREVVHAVAMRREPVMATALRFLGSTMRNDPERVPVEYDNLLDSGLDAILLDTGSTRRVVDCEYDAFVVRYFAASLVTAMEAAGRGNPATHAAWSSAIGADPLPDTRRARDFERRATRCKVSVPTDPPNGAGAAA